MDNYIWEFIFCKEGCSEPCDKYKSAGTKDGISILNNFQKDKVKALEPVMEKYKKIFNKK